MKKKLVKAFLKKIVSCKGIKELEGRYKLVKKIPFSFIESKDSKSLIITYGQSNKPQEKKRKSNTYTLNFQTIIVPKRHILNAEQMFINRAPSECSYNIKHIGQAFINMKTNKLGIGSCDQTHGKIDLSPYKN